MEKKSGENGENSRESEKVEKMEKILAILEKIIVTIPTLLLCTVLLAMSGPA